MKRGTPEHPKLHELCRQLGGIPKYQAVGLLESLWHFAAQFARRGDIGRFHPEAIARAIGWEGDPVVLIRALLASRWLDHCACHQLRVHDWPQHVDQGVERSKEVKKDGFLDCYLDNSSRRLDGDYQPAGPAVAVAVAGALAIAGASAPSGGQQTPPAADPKPAEPPKRRMAESWSQEACEDWRVALGVPHGGRIGAALKPLAKEHGWSVVRPLWQEAIADAKGWDDPGKFTPETFARTFLARLERARSPGAGSGLPRGIVDGTMAWLERQGGS